MALDGKQLASWRGHAAPFIEDLASGELVAGDTARLEAIEQQAGPCELVHVEQPWLWPVADALQARGRIGKFRRVYGSQNIEYKLKRAIFAQYGVQQDQVLAGIEALERRAAAEAAVVAAVTREDAAVLREWTSAPVVVAANGIQPWSADAQAVERWRGILGPEPFALYVASAHPPNVIGFCESFGVCLAALSPVQKIVIAGGVAEHIVKTDWHRKWGPLNARRMHVVGPVSHEDLSALRDLAHVFVLPMTSGEGSNLKSAEALYSGRWVLATPHAMRGYEDFAGVARLAVEAPGLAFARALSRLLAQAVPAARADEPSREALTWAHTLAPLVDAVNALGTQA